jgi:uncharacterized protein
MRSFLILHGWQGSGPDHWQTWLAQRLATAGERVRYPDLPDADEPDADAWAEALHEELGALGGERTVVCHSLACLLWTREARRVAAAPVDRVLLVAPPCPVQVIPEAASFYPAHLDAGAVAAAARHTRVAGSDADPYCPAGAKRSLADPLGLPFDLLPGAGHVNPEAGFGPWPAVEAWCYGAKNGVET